MLQIRDYEPVYASIVCKSASLALEDTGRTEEVSTAKMLVNTNDMQAHKPERKWEVQKQKKKEIRFIS